MSDDLPVIADWDAAAVADDYLRAALVQAAETIERADQRLTDLREEHLRTAVYEALDARLPGHVRKEQTRELAAFRGAGGFDVLVDRSPGGEIAWLAEVKWSYTTRSKIYEAAWDAVKLCLAAAEHHVARCWLITGAPAAQWAATETRELFVAGPASFETVWSQPLVPPGPNGGTTVGADVLAGGRGNRFTRAPETFVVEEVGVHELRRGGEHWSVRAVAVTAASRWIEDFAPAPVFPKTIGQPWLNNNVPEMSGEEFDELIEWLRLKRWTPAELAERVYPLRGGT